MASSNFIRDIIDQDVAAGRTQVVTRFPPEPNGYLHIGHAKSICLNFGIARDYPGAHCNLRFDDTNPEKELPEYERAIQDDVHWLGFDWEERLYHASDYFEKLYEFAEHLIQAGKAFVCDLTAEEIRRTRGTTAAPGQESPHRGRSVAENLDLFRRMRAGEFPDGARVLRAKIDMASPNLNLRDPPIYRIRHRAHHHAGDKWCLYPLYDYTHCISDALEGITHSLCTIEFEDHRPLYDWVLDQLPIPCHPRQIEFARLELNYTVTSKRKLQELVQGGHVSGWDDPRLPTLQGIRRRGYTPEALRDFCERIGITKKETVIDMALLESCIREGLDKSAPRALAVLRPLRCVIENYPEGQEEVFTCPNHPQDPSLGERSVPFAREILIEAEDFLEDPPKDFFRLAPGREVRLRFAYLVRCVGVEKDAAGRVTGLRLTYDPATRGGNAPDGRKVKGTIHWVSAAHGRPAEVHLYDRLFTCAEPGRKGPDGVERDFKLDLNPDSHTVLTEAWVEPSLAAAAPEARFQFERLGYYCADRRDHRPGERLVFNRTVPLRDLWAKLAAGRPGG
jgi:glutaminyl-tRNA synthetase